MNEQPQRREVSEGVGFEDAAQVGFDIGGTGQARIVAHETQVQPVRAKSPERAFTGIQPFLQRG